jgi:hypothetical protein
MIDDSTSTMQKLTFKSLYLWEGDCGGSAGSKTPPSSSTWTAYTVEASTYKNKGSMKTEALKIDSNFNGGFCVSFNSVNRGTTTCNNFAVEVNMNPATYKLQKHTTSLRKIIEDIPKGVN